MRRACRDPAARWAICGEGRWSVPLPLAAARDRGESGRRVALLVRGALDDLRRGETARAAVSLEGVLRSNRPIPRRTGIWRCSIASAGDSTRRSGISKRSSLTRATRTKPFAPPPNGDSRRCATSAPLRGAEHLRAAATRRDAEPALPRPLRRASRRSVARLRGHGAAAISKRRTATSSRDSASRRPSRPASCSTARRPISRPISTASASRPWVSSTDASTSRRPRIPPARCARCSSTNSPTRSFAERTGGDRPFWLNEGLAELAERASRGERGVSRSERALLAASHRRRRVDPARTSRAGLRWTRRGERAHRLSRSDGRRRVGRVARGRRGHGRAARRDRRRPGFRRRTAPRHRRRHRATRLHPPPRNPIRVRQPLGVENAAGRVPPRGPFSWMAKWVRPSGGSSWDSTRSTRAWAGPSWQNATAAATRCWRALEDGLDAAVGAVAHPSRDAERARLALRRIAEPHALHPPANHAAACGSRPRPSRGSPFEVATLADHEVTARRSARRSARRTRGCDPAAPAPSREPRVGRGPSGDPARGARSARRSRRRDRNRRRHERRGRDAARRDARSHDPAARRHGRAADAGGHRPRRSRRSTKAACTPAATTRTSRCSRARRACSRGAATRSRGTVKLLFQPGEEGYGGARILIDEGLLDAEPRSTRAFAIHVDSSLPRGRIASRPGAILASADADLDRSHRPRRPRVDAASRGRPDPRRVRDRDGAPESGHAAHRRLRSGRDHDHAASRPARRAT